MKRVVVTGLGVVSSIGNNAAEVTQSLRDGKSGIEFVPQYTRARLPQPGRRHAEDQRRRAGRPPPAPLHGRRRGLRLSRHEAGDRRRRPRARPRSPTSAPAWSPARAGRPPAPSCRRPSPPRRRGPSASVRSRCRAPCRAPSRPTSRPPTRSRASATRSARPARPRRTASATPSRCIQLGKADRMFAGGGEELDWTLSVLFDAMGAMSSKYNDTPERASRAYDKDRDGFVISGGGGILVLEELEDATRARRQDLCRGRRLRRHLRRRRHGGAVRRRRGALHEARHGRLPGRGAAQCAGRLHQHPRHLDAGGRHHRARRHPRRLRQQQAAGRQLDQVADRPQPGRDRRARGDLFAADDEGRFHRGLGQHREPRPRRRATIRSRASASTMPACRP